jgi:hypothetical protein
LATERELRLLFFERIFFACCGRLPNAIADDAAMDRFL